MNDVVRWPYLAPDQVACSPRGPSGAQVFLTQGTTHDMKDGICRLTGLDLASRNSESWEALTLEAESPGWVPFPQWAYSASRKASLVPRAARAAVPSRPTPRITSNVTPIVDQGMGIPGFVTFLMAIAKPVENPTRVATA